MIDRWGVSAVLGNEPDFCLLIRATRLLSIYRVFEKAGRSGGLKKLDDREKRIHASIMLLSGQASDFEYFDLRVYELVDRLV